MEIATFVIAVVGIVLAAVSLGWQAATFFLSGPRVKVTLREGFRGLAGVMLGPSSMYTADGLQVLEQQGYTEHVLAIEAVNVGRLPATVNRWTIIFGNRAALENLTDPRNPGLPYRLEPHTSALWYVPVEQLQELQAAFTDQSEAAARARGAVDLGTRKTVMSKNAILVDAAGTHAPSGWRVGLPRRRG